jgi:ribonuclease HIII
MQVEKLRHVLEMQQWEFYNVPYAHYGFRGNKVNVVAYQSGTVVIQGSKAMDLMQFTIEPEIMGAILLGYEEHRHPEWFIEHGGMDESGKGDLFGPLVTACVIADGKVVKQWIDLGVKDSKTIHSSSQIFALDAKIRKSENVVVEVFLLSMRKYNELYGKFSSNLNRLLAWYHSTSLRNARIHRPVQKVILDQFSTAPLVQRFFTDDRDLDIAMRPRAEEDPVVAAASIVARAEYLRAMEDLSENAGEELLRGANNSVLEQAKRLVKKFGANRLGDFAKMHFSTAQKAVYA